MSDLEPLDPVAAEALFSLRAEEALSERDRQAVWDRLRADTSLRRVSVLRAGTLAAVIAVAAAVVVWSGARWIGRRTGEHSFIQAEHGRGAGPSGQTVIYGGRGSARTLESADGPGALDPIPEPGNPEGADFPSDSTGSADAAGRLIRAMNVEPAGPANPRTEASRPRRSPVRSTRAEAVSITQETALLKAAQSALAQGEPSRALALLNDAQERFSGGSLHEEREALRVVALCGSGRLVEGKAAKEAFLARHRGSALGDRVIAACE